MPCVSVRSIDPDKLRSDAVLDNDDIEVRHIAHFSEVRRPESVDVFAETIAKWLQEAYRSPLKRTQTHTGAYTMSSSSSGFQASTDERHCQQANGGGRPLQTLARTQSTEPELELQARPFFERSAVFLRIKPPTKWFRGYGRSQPFMAQDIFCWQRIRDHDWSLVMEDKVDVLVFLNYWFECDFTWEVLQYMFTLDPREASFGAIIAGDAINSKAIVDVACMDGLCLQVSWFCQVCQDDGKPTMNTATIPAQSSQSDDGPYRHDFCSSCRTYRYDHSMWLCMGPPARTWPRTRSKPCNRAIQMFQSRVGVPCCPACETVRHEFHGRSVFESFSNSADEPLPVKVLRA